MLICFPVHECAHAWTAYILGDDTGKIKGRITLNPFRHLDPYGALMVLVAGVGYAKPVPVNPSKFKNRKLDMALTAFAGPFSNLAMAVLILILIKGGIFGYPYAFYMARYTAFINISLALFNMIPVPPLDGSKVLGAFLPGDAFDNFLKKGSKLWLILLLGMMMSGRMGYSPVGTASSAVFHYLYNMIVLGRSI